MVGHWCALGLRVLRISVCTTHAQLLGSRELNNACAAHAQISCYFGVGT